MTKRRKFSREFKLAAVEKVIQTGLSTAEVARNLGVSQTLSSTGNGVLKRMERST